jgi:environmental stress-induced protein Ves
MRIIRAADYRRMQWKNGGGETIEVAVSPPESSLEDFHWRVSMAHIASAGPFSHFAGIDRSLALLAGDGIVLRLGGRGEVPLTRAAAPLAFPGDLPVDATLVGGPIDDLNVMSRRGRYRHLLSRVRAAGTTVLPRHGDIMIVLVGGSAANARCGSQREAVADGDTILLDEAEKTKLEIVPENAAELFVVDLWRVSG